MVPESTRRAGPFEGNGVTTSFPFEFKTNAKVDLLVVRLVDSIEVDLVLDSDYSVTLNSDQEASPGGSITYPISGSPLAADEFLTIISDLTIEQKADLPNLGAFYPTVIEAALDRAVMLIGQLQEQLDRAIVLQPSASTVAVELPAPQAGTAIGWNGTADALVNIVSPTGTLSVSDFCKTLLDDTSANAFLTTLTATRSETGGASVPVLTKLRRVVDILDFGGVGDDVTDNTTAFTNANNALSTNGGIIMLPPGTYRVTGALPQLAAGVSVVGYGSRASCIKTSHATADVLTVGDRALVHGVKFASSVTRTGGSYLKVAGNGTMIDGVEMEGSYIGIYLYAAALYTTTGVDITRSILRSGSASAGSAYVLIENFGDVNINGMTISGNTTVAANQSTNGIKITGADTVTISDSNITQAGIAIDITPTAGNISSVWVDSTYCDWNAKAGLPGARVGIYSGANSARRIRFFGCWFGTNSGEGLLIEQTAGTGELDGVDVSSPHAYNNGSYGIKVAGSAKNVHIHGGEAAGNVGSGVYIGGTVDTFSVIGARLGPFADYGANGTYGVELAGSADHGRVGMNDLRGNTGGAVLNGTTGTDLQIRNNLGWTTENGGTQVILSGTTAITVTHNLSRTPAAKEIWVTPTQNPTNDPGNMWVDTITSTQFNVNVRNNPGASNMSFAWGARLQ